MATKITKSKVSQKDVFGDIKTSAEGAKIAVDNLNESLVRDLESQVKLAKALKTSAEGAKKLAKIDKENAATLKQKIDLDKKAIALDKQVVALISAEERELTRARKEKERLLNLKKKDELQTKKAIALSKKQNSVIFKQSQQIKFLSDKYRTLIIEEGKETKQSRKVLAQVLKLKKARDQASEALGNHQAKVGRYEKALGSLRNTLGQLGLAFGVFSILKSSFATLAEYDEKIADIQKTTGLAAKDARLLSIALLEIDTRSIVTELQELASAAGRLGIEGEQNILGFVTAADKAFVALGDDLGGSAEEIATDLGKIAENFGLIEEFGIQEGIERVGSTMNELAANTKASAGAIFEFTKRMSGIAAVADISQQDIQALGALFDSTGQSMEIAASTLAKLLPALSSDQERFAEVAGLTADEFSRILNENPIEALKAVASGAKSSEGGLDGLVQTLEAFGIESARSAGIVGILASNTDELTRLQGIANAAFEANISITDEFNTKNQTVNAGVSKLKKAWDAIIITWNEGNGVGEKIIKVLKFLTDNLKTIVKTVILAIKFWIAWRIQVALFGKEFSKLTLGKFIRMAKVMVTRTIPNMIKGFKLASLSAKGFGTAIKSIPFVSIISFLVTAGPLIWDFAKGLFSAEESTTALQDATKKANKEIFNQKAGMESLFQQLKRTNKGSNERADLIKKINDEYGTTLENLENESEFVNQLEESYDALNQQMEKRIKTQIFQEQLTELIREELRFRKAIEEAVTGRTIQDDELRNIRDVFGTEALVDATKEIVRQKNEIFDALNEGGTLGKDSAEIIRKGGGLEVEEDKKDGKKPKTQEQLNRERFAAFKKANAIFLKLVEAELLIEGESRAKIDEQLKEDRLTTLKLEQEEALKLFGEFSKEFVDANLALQKALEEPKKAIVDNDKQTLDDLIKQNAENLIIIETNLRAASKTEEQISDALAKARIANLRKVLEFAIEAFGKESEEALAAQDNLNKAIGAMSKSLDKKDPANKFKDLQKAIEGANQAIVRLAENSLKLLDDQIEKQDQLFNDSKDRENEIREIAKEKNLDATEAITFEREEQKRAAEEKRKLQQKQLQIEGLLAAFKLIQTGLSAAEAATSLQTLAGEIPGLIEGTEFGVSDALGYKPGVDSHTVNIDNREGVINPANMQKLGIKKGQRSMSDVVDIIGMHDKGILQSSIRDSIPNIQVMAQNVGGVSSGKIENLLTDLVRNTDPSQQPSGKQTFDALTGLWTFSNRVGNRKRISKFKP